MTRVDGPAGCDIQPRGVPAGLSGVSQAWGDAVVPLEECSSGEASVSPL